MGAGEENGVWRFLKQVEMETQGDIGVFNYLQIQSNFLLFLTTPPTARLMGVLNKEAWRSRLFDCGLVGRSRRRSVFIRLPCSTFLCHLAAFIGAFFFFQWCRNFKVHFNFCVDVDKLLPESERYSYAASRQEARTAMWIA